MERMQAVRFHEYGGPEVLKLEEVPRQDPGHGEVLIRIRAAGVNPIDWKVRAGYFKEYLKHSLPLIPGWDVSGVVAAVGAGAERWKKGDEVYGRPDVARDGAYAEYLVARESEIELKPKSVSHLDAAAIPLAALTAWQSIFGAAGLDAGQRVLIHGAAGGVGSYAVQLARWKGAHVIGTASARNQGFLRELGADEALDYTETRFEDVVRDVDVVFDTIGGETERRSWKTLKKGGILVSIVGSPSPEEAAAHGVRQARVGAQTKAAQLKEIADLVDSRKLRAHVETVLPLRDARRAHELSQTGHTRGKIVLRVA